MELALCSVQRVVVWGSNWIRLVRISNRFCVYVDVSYFSEFFHYIQCQNSYLHDTDLLKDCMNILNESNWKNVFFYIKTTFQFVELKFWAEFYKNDAMLSEYIWNYSNLNKKIGEYFKTIFKTPIYWSSK